MPTAANFAELKQHILDVPTKNITQITLTNDIVVTETLPRPATIKASGKCLYINGNGRTLKAGPGVTTMFGGSPIDQSDALSKWQSQRFVFENTHFEGSGGVAIGWGCTYGSAVYSCTFKNFDWGIDIRFGLLLGEWASFIGKCWHER
jgi:hypothetical protein